MEFAFPESDDEVEETPKKKSFMPWSPQGQLGLKEAEKHKEISQEVLFESKLMLSRPMHFPLEFLLPKNGKKLIEGKKVRALQSKISLKFPLAANEKEKQRLKPMIKQ